MTSSPPKSFSSNSLIGVPPSTRAIFEIAGYGLFIYGLFNILMAIISKGSGAAAMILRASQISGLLPFMLLGPALIFAGPDKTQNDSSRRVIKWLTLFVALLYTVSIPVILYNFHSFRQEDTNSLNAFQSRISKKRQAILTALAPLNSPLEIGAELLKYPEISKININPNQSPRQIKELIMLDIEAGIKADIEDLKIQKAKRMEQINNTLINGLFGTIISSVSMLALSAQLHEWLKPAALAVSRSGSGLSQGLLILPKLLCKNVSHNLQGLNKYWQQWQRRRQHAKNKRSFNSNSRSKRR
jgi:hypothetical protein